MLMHLKIPDQLIYFVIHYVRVILTWENIGSVDCRYTLWTCVIFHKLYIKLFHTHIHYARVILTWENIGSVDCRYTLWNCVIFHKLYIKLFHTLETFYLLSCLRIVSSKTLGSKYRNMYLELISSPLAQTDSQSTKKFSDYRTIHECQNY